MGAAENKAAMRRIMEDVINEKNLDVAYELYSEEHELHPEVPGIGDGAEGMKRAFAGLHEQFPDVRVTIESMVAEEDMVAVRLTYSGTDAATGQRATWPEMVFTRFSGGKAAESWEVIDTGRSPDSPPGRPRPPLRLWLKSGPGSPQLVRRRARSTMSSTWCDADAAPAGRGRFSWTSKSHAEESATAAAKSSTRT